MVLVTGNWKLWLAGMATSLIIFAVLFFTVIQPSSDTANQAVKTGLKQSQQVLNQAQQQIKSANSASGQASGQAKKVNQQAHKVLSNASKLTSCVAAAGTDPSKLASCQSKFAGQ
jgi:F0F1-type ATP synthase membrane subunit b/b'